MRSRFVSAALVGLVIAGQGRLAAQTPNAPPASGPSESIFLWIRQHMPSFDTKPYGNLSGLGLRARTDHVSVTVAAQRCLVLYEREDKTDWLNNSGNHEYFWDSFETATLDMSLADPDAVAVSTDPRHGNPVVTLSFAQPFLLRTDTYVPDSATAGNSSLAVTTTMLAIPFATEDLARRQARAWRDAIAACRPRAVPENLY